MFDLRFQTALFSAKFLKFVINKTGGGATAAPGLAGLYIDSAILEKLSSNLETTILVTGTNGKTTTTRLIGDFLEKIGTNYISNRHGSNLERGLISAFLGKISPNGKLKIKTALFEVDEAALGTVISKMHPTILVITNLFRDQLDRYGEIDNIRKIWEKCVEKLDENATLILNGDDPTLAYLGERAACKVIYFGINDKDQLNQVRPLSVDTISCPNCHGELDYSGYFISHQGNYSCQNCSFSKPKLDISADNIKMQDNQSGFNLVSESKSISDLVLKIPGLYNVYNCLAAFTALKTANLSLDSFPKVVSSFKPVFGRAEKLSHQGKNITVALAKNPTGFGEVIKAYLSQKPQTVLIIINDLIADGRDVSWLWDVDFESLKEKGHKFITSGIRGTDMSLRLKYAGLACENVEKVEKALDLSLGLANNNLLIIPTYTALLNLKKLFVNKGIGGEFWKD